MARFSPNADFGFQPNLPYAVSPSLTGKGGLQKMVLEQQCLCGTKDCGGLSSAFRVLGRKDPRSYFHRIPRRMSKKHDSKDRAAIEAIRTAYIETLFPDEDHRPKLKAGKDYYIAKHHFPPGLVLNYPKLPYTLPDNILMEHKVKLDGMRALGTLLSGHHPCEKSLMVVPNYPREEARQDLQSLLSEEERSRLYETRQRLKRRNSSGSLKRLLRQNSSSSVGRSWTLSHEDEDDPTETTCSWDGSSSFTGPTADMDLWYERSQRITLPPTPLGRPGMKEDAEEDDLLLVRIASDDMVRASPQILPEVPSGNLISSPDKASKEENKFPFPEFAFLERTDPHRPPTPASTDNLPKEIFDCLKRAKVGRISNRKAVAKKTEFKYLILHRHRVARRPNTGIFFVDYVVRGVEQEVTKLDTQKQAASGASVLSRLAALASLSGDDEPDMASAPPPHVAPSSALSKAPDTDEESGGSGYTGYVAKGHWTAIQNLGSFRTTSVYDTDRSVSSYSDRSVSSRSSDDGESDLPDERKNSQPLQSMLEVTAGYDSGGSLTLPEAAENTCMTNTPCHVHRRVTRTFSTPPRSMSHEPLGTPDPIHLADAVIKASSYCGESVDLAEIFKSAQTEVDTDAHKAIVDDPVFDPSENKDTQQGFDSIPATDLLAGVLGEDPIVDDFAKAEQDSEPTPEIVDDIAKAEQDSEPTTDSIPQEDTSDSSTDSRESSISSGRPYDRTEGMGKPESAPPKVPSGVLVTVLESSHLNTLLGDDDEDSDFEEKWEKANRRKQEVATSAAPNPFARTKALTKASADLKHPHANRPEEMPTPAISRAVVSPDTKAPVPAGSTNAPGPAALSRQVVAGRQVGAENASLEAEDAKGASDLNACSTFDGLCDRKNEDSNAVNTLANLSEEDSTDRGHEIEVLEFQPAQNDCETSDVSSSSSSSASDDSSSEGGSVSSQGSRKPSNSEKISKAVDTEGIQRTTAPHGDQKVESSLEIAMHSVPSNNSQPGLKKFADSAELDLSQSTRDASGDEDSQDSQWHSQNDTLTAEDTTEGSNAVNTLSTPEEQEELAYLDMLAVEEDERHDWFVTMQKTVESEYNCYVQILVTMNTEADQIYSLMDFSHQAVDIYTKTISQVCSDPIFASSTGPGSEIMEALLESYKALSSRFKEKLPVLGASVYEMSSYKSELNRSIRVVQNRGYSMLQELTCSEEAVRKCWAVLEESSSRLPDNSPSSHPNDRWLEEVDYRQAVTKQLSLWRERTGDMKDLTTRILEMECECHKRLKDILLGFLPKRHDLFVGVRDLLDPAVDALETSTLLSEMAEVDRRLEQAVLHFQPEKKRSILSLMPSSSAVTEKPPSIPSLDNFSSLMTGVPEVFKKSENVLSYSFIKSQLEGEWVQMMIVVTRQYFLHTCLLPVNAACPADGAPDDEVVACVRLAIETGSALESVGLISCDLELHEEVVEIYCEKESSEEDDKDETTEKVLKFQFASPDEASQWLFEAKSLFDPVQDHDKSDTPKLEIVRV